MCRSTVRPATEAVDSRETAVCRGCVSDAQPPTESTAGRRPVASGNSVGVRVCPVRDCRRETGWLADWPPFVGASRRSFLGVAPRSTVTAIEVPGAAPDTCVRANAVSEVDRRWSCRECCSVNVPRPAEPVDCVFRAPAMPRDRFPDWTGIGDWDCSRRWPTTDRRRLVENNSRTAV
ncbi:hypothetical protein [Halohasta litchfieldiae]|uniref:hypothetical protein n=1 Tax=Halohasta litchfieldiae TaxID=1073996 RepID=UPI00115FA5DE|nr:hypothetical protein [Halohasta litchfieldiae]